MHTSIVQIQFVYESQSLIVPLGIASRTQKTICPEDTGNTGFMEGKGSFVIGFNRMRIPSWEFGGWRL